MALSDYTAAVEVAHLRVAPGDELESSRICYQAHKVTGPNRGAGVYVGKWSGKTTSLDAATTLTPAIIARIRAADFLPPPGLSANVIAYRCKDNPDEPELFNMTGQHRGSRGFITGDAYCVINMQHAFIPQS